MTTHPAAPQLDSDPVLLTRGRSGDTAAYAELFAHHRGAALAFARSLAGTNHAEDLVAEAFTRVLDALQRDLGPTVSFRSYLLTSIRSLWANTVRSETRYDLVEDYETVPALDAVTFSDDPDGRFDNQAIAAAYQGLSERWQAVLWYTEVEGLPHAEVAHYLGIKPNAVAALSFRAREGLRQAYLAEHLSDVDDAVCRAMVELLPAYARGSLAKRKRPTLQAHLQDCRPCTVALADLDGVNHRLGALLLPIVCSAGAAKLGWLTEPPTGASKATGAGFGVVKTGVVALLASAAVVAAIGVPLLHSVDDPRPGRDEAAVELDPPLPVDSRRQVTLTARRPPRPATTSPSAQSAPGMTSHEIATVPGADEARSRAIGVSTRSSSAAAAGAVPVAPKVGPATSSASSRDVGATGISFRKASVAGESVSKISIALANLHQGSIVTTDVTNLAGRPRPVHQELGLPGSAGRPAHDRTGPVFDHDRVHLPGSLRCDRAPGVHRVHLRQLHGHRDHHARPGGGRPEPLQQHRDRDDHPVSGAGAPWVGAGAAGGLSAS